MRIDPSSLSSIMTPASAAPLSSYCDLLVIGSGAGGLSAAVVAARLGLKVLVVEKEPFYGGTTAWSGGWMWIPRNPLAVAANITEDLDQPLAYLRHELGAQFDEGRARAFLENGPRMVEFFRRHTALEFVDGNAVPDFHGNTPGAVTGGRSVCAAPFDARRLGGRIIQLKPPLAETTLWGMGIAGTELRHFLNASRSAKSLCYVARRVIRHWRDLLLHGRGMWLVNGNALVARLAASAFEAGVELRVSCPARRLLRQDGRVVGAVVSTPQGELEIHAARGVVLACGGFPHDVKRKRELLPHTSTGEEHWSAASLGNTGDGLTLGESAGGTIARDLESAAALAPVSLVPRRDGTVAHFPHLIERAKPGLIAVVRNGRRFTNEADSYHDFMRGLLKATQAGQPAEAWLICDHRFIRRYGLGAVKPAPMPMRASLRSGYLKGECSLAALAQACGIDADELQRTVQRYNLQARSGADPDFGKGETPYNRVQGDASLDGPNPCMAPIEHGPFYAVRIVAGSLGTFAGLVTNASAQVLDERRQPIPGLYAGGNDMSSVMGGNYPSGGITLGPAMTFGFVAACHAAGRDPARVA
jgi:succinate dehydrogenase/fumarate reductase flavoprotein subunit